jgi:hypothetical protein
LGQVSWQLCGNFSPSTADDYLRPKFILDHPQDKNTTTFNERQKEQESPCRPLATLAWNGLAAEVV